MNNAEWFSNQIDASTESLAWGLEQIPSDRLYAAPPAKLGEWSPGRHIFHLLYYLARSSATQPEALVW